MKNFIIPSRVKELPPKPQKEPSLFPNRQAKLKHSLLESGGKRVSVNLTGQAVADLEAIKARDGTDNTGAIIAALRRHAKLCERGTIGS